MLIKKYIVLKEVQPWFITQTHTNARKRETQNRKHFSKYRTLFRESNMLISGNECFIKQVLRSKVCVACFAFRETNCESQPINIWRLVHMIKKWLPSWSRLQRFNFIITTFSVDTLCEQNGHTFFFPRVFGQGMKEKSVKTLRILFKNMFFHHLQF